jgi:hypothetical protein
MQKPVGLPRADWPVGRPQTDWSCRISSCRQVGFFDNVSLSAAHKPTGVADRLALSGDDQPTGCYMSIFFTITSKFVINHKKILFKKKFGTDHKLALDPIPSRQSHARACGHFFWCVLQLFPLRQAHIECNAAAPSPWAIGVYVLVRCVCVACMYLCVELYAAFESDETAQPSGLALAATCMHYLRVRQVVRVRVVWCARGIHIDPYVFRSPDMHAWAASGVLPCIP